MSKVNRAVKDKPAQEHSNTDDPVGRTGLRPPVQTDDGGRRETHVKQVMVDRLPHSTQKDELIQMMADHAGKPWSDEDRAAFNALYDAAPQSNHKHPGHI